MYRAFALFRLRERAFFRGRKFSPWFQLYGEALLIHSSPNFAALRRVPGCLRAFRDPSFFWRLRLSKGFLHGFSSMEKHCSYISFSSICRFAAKSRKGASVSGIPSFFLRVYVVERFSPWFQLHGEALLIHFILSPAAAGLLGWELRGSSFFIRDFSRFGEKFCIEDFLCYNRKVEIS